MRAKVAVTVIIALLVAEFVAHQSFDHPRNRFEAPDQRARIALV